MPQCARPLLKLVLRPSEVDFLLSALQNCAQHIKRLKERERTIALWSRFLSGVRPIVPVLYIRLAEQSGVSVR